MWETLVKFNKLKRGYTQSSQRIATSRPRAVLESTIVTSLALLLVVLIPSLFLISWAVTISMRLARRGFSQHRYSKSELFAKEGPPQPYASLTNESLTYSAWPCTSSVAIGISPQEESSHWIDPNSTRQRGVNTIISADSFDFTLGEQYEN